MVYTLFCLCVQVPRQFPYDNLYLERGGDPNVPPEQREKLDKDSKVRASYGEFMS